jgi:hypothetical protein
VLHSTERINKLVNDHHLVTLVVTIEHYFELHLLYLLLSKGRYGKILRVMARYTDFMGKEYTFHDVSHRTFFLTHGAVDTR